MPRGKVKLEKIRGSLETLCPSCGYSIPPNELQRIDSTRVHCPKCQKQFVPRKTG
jgi:predicted RNA-binding Zn-ribbon protein involved in translation (DUF1610 family)